MIDMCLYKGGGPTPPASVPPPSPTDAADNAALAYRAQRQRRLGGSFSNSILGGRKSIEKQPRGSLLGGY
jgi:hypothetical protein